MSNFDQRNYNQKLIPVPDLSLSIFSLQGYVMVEDLVPKADLESAKEDIKRSVEELAQKLFKAGKIKSMSIW